MNSHEEGCPEPYGDCRCYCEEIRALRGAKKLVMAERAAIVTWLRADADDDEAGGSLRMAMQTRALADAIERGEHLEKKP